MQDRQVLWIEQLVILSRILKTKGILVRQLVLPQELQLVCMYLDILY